MSFSASIHFDIYSFFLSSDYLRLQREMTQPNRDIINDDIEDANGEKDGGTSGSSTDESRETELPKSVVNFRRRPNFRQAVRMLNEGRRGGWNLTDIGDSSLQGSRSSQGSKSRTKKHTRRKKRRRRRRRDIREELESEINEEESYEYDNESESSRSSSSIRRQKREANKNNDRTGSGSGKKKRRRKNGGGGNRRKRMYPDVGGFRYRRSCSRQKMYVDFEEIGWSGWIISPKGYDAFHCHGECPFPLGQSQKPTNHATVQSIVHALGASNKHVGTPCCVPNKLFSISLLYFDDDENVILKQYDDMVAASCGCH